MLTMMSEKRIDSVDKKFQDVTMSIYDVESLLYGWFKLNRQTDTQVFCGGELYSFEPIDQIG